MGFPRLRIHMTFLNLSGAFYATLTLQTPRPDHAPVKVAESVARAQPRDRGHIRLRRVRRRCLRSDRGGEGDHREGQLGYNARKDCAARSFLCRRYNNGEVFPPFVPGV